MSTLFYEYLAVSGKRMSASRTYKGNKEGAIKKLLLNNKWSCTPIVSIEGVEVKNPIMSEREVYVLDSFRRVCEEFGVPFEEVEEVVRRHCF